MPKDCMPPPGGTCVFASDTFASCWSQARGVGALQLWCQLQEWVGFPILSHGARQFALPNQWARWVRGLCTTSRSRATCYSLGAWCFWWGASTCIFPSLGCMFVYLPAHFKLDQSASSGASGLCWYAQGDLQIQWAWGMSVRVHEHWAGPQHPARNEWFWARAAGGGCCTLYLT